jgi:two-component system, OmpR family, sensor kinase
VSAFRSLRWRLTALIGAVVVLAMGATFVAIYRGTGTQLRQQIDRELGAAADTFARTGVPDGDPTPTQVERSGRRFISGQRFHASSRLLIVSLPNGVNITNEPELLALAPEAGDSAEDVAKDQAEARALLNPRPGYSNVPLADVGTLRLYRQHVTRAGHPVAVVGVGEPLAPVERAEREVARTFLVAGSATLLIALLLGYLVATRTAGPLRRMARIAARVDAGELSPRMAQQGPRDEVRALADSFDFMLDRLEDAFARQRAFASDASHELRTPLTVIRGQLEVLARQPNPAPEDVRRVERLVRIEILRMERLVDDLLVLARAEEQEFLRPRKIDLPEFASELLEGVRTTADRRFELGPIPEGSIEADPDRVVQALRNLLRNAVDYTSDGGLVRLVGSAAGDRVTLAVEDDGPGIPVEHRERVFDRFHRTDSARTRAHGGSGLGLAIARAVAEAHGGTISASDSPEGGARVAIELPGFRPAGSADADGPASGDEPRPAERVP